MESTLPLRVDLPELENQIKKVYKQVALNPKGAYHFETGRGLAEKLGYAKENLDKIPATAIDSFAGSGFFFDMVDLVQKQLHDSMILWTIILSSKAKQELLFHISKCRQCMDRLEFEQMLKSKLYELSKFQNHEHTIRKIEKLIATF